MQGLKDRRRFPERQQARHIRKVDRTVDRCAVNRGKIGQRHHHDRCPDNARTIVRVDPGHAMHDVELVFDDDQSAQLFLQPAGFGR